MSDSRRGALTLCCLAICALPTLHGAALAEGTACKYVSQLPDDCAGAVLRKYDNLRNYRYEEIDLFARDVIKKVLYVSSYNTTGLQWGRRMRRLSASTSCPQSGSQGDCQAVPGAERVGEPASVLDDRLARRPISEGSGVLATSTPRGWATARRQRLRTWPNRARGPIAICPWLEPSPKDSKRDRKCTYSMIPRAEPGS